MTFSSLAVQVECSWRVVPVDGQFKGGTYCIAPDGREPAYDANGVFQYFGVFKT
jgi:hypothetical protein